MSDLITNYLNIDFDTLVYRLREEIKNSTNINDVNYEGSNINVLIELFAYISELNVYYNNKLAKNQFIDTVDIYENAHRLATFMGYNPKGWLASTGNIDVILKFTDETKYDDFIKKWKPYIPSWIVFKSSAIDSNGENIQFITTKQIGFDDTDNILKTTDVSETNDDTDFDIYADTYLEDDYEDYGYVIYKNVPIKQGKIIEFTKTYNDLLDYKIILPTYNFAYDENISDENNVIEVKVNNTTWNRIENFYDDISGIQNANTINDPDNVYRFLYNKHGQYYIEFSTFRNTPGKEDIIDIKVIETIGQNGDVAKNTITDYSYNNEFFETDESYSIDFESFEITVNNNVYTYGGNEPEDLDDLKLSVAQSAHTQFRTVTKTDYKIYLENSNLVSKAIAWGEQEEDVGGGNVFHYNKVFISVLPDGDGFDDWNNRMDLEDGFPKTDILSKPDYTESDSVITINKYKSYDDTFQTNVWNYLEPTKMLGTHEKFIVPDFIYFYISLSLKIKDSYSFNDVRNDLSSKLIYYFNNKNRSYGEEINIINMINTLMSPLFIQYQTNGEINYFYNTLGVSNILIRDIKYYKINEDNTLSGWCDINEYNNEDDLYPQNSNNPTDEWFNKISNIQLGKNQFPILESNSIDINRIY